MSIINDINAKCVKQQSDLFNLISDIKKGSHDNCLDKMKEKIEEKISSLTNSIVMLEKSVELTSISSDQSFIWKHKINHFKEQKESARKLLEQSISSQKSRLQLKNNKVSSIFHNDNDISQLTNEHESLMKTLKFSRELDSKQGHVLEELDTQQSILEKIKNKTLSILNIANFSNTITMWIIKRSKNDILLFFSLCFLTVVVIYITTYYIKPYIRG